MRQRLCTLAVVLWLGLVACNPAPSAPPPTATVPATAASAPTPLLTIVGTGGLCPYGLCYTEFNLDSLGNYTWHEGDMAQHPGQFAPAEIADLQTQMAAADFSAIKAQPFTDTCPTAMDGSEVTYTFYTSHGVEVIASCTVVIDPQHPLFQQADALWHKAFIP